MKNDTKEMIYQTKIGKLGIIYCGTVVTRIHKVDDNLNISTDSNQVTNQAYIEIEEYLEGKRTHFDFPYKLEGTDFQLSVWKALQEIPYGETRSYREIAEEIGNPKAARAVGMANNKNPIMIVVPCHRVIGASGELVGYAGGLTIKKKLLDLERQ